jgi:ubiquinone/menaquinone biosynthesis C-methylase UbiE
MEAINFLKENLSRESTMLFGIDNKEFVSSISSAWMDDENNSRHRFIEIELFLPDAQNILDMASGCGTFVFYGLLNGYNVYGIEPEKWKNRFNHFKISEKMYDERWKHKFLQSIGEELPFKDNSFDCVSTYQTLEHVRDVERCLHEMLRITRNGGGIHIHCPDFFSTFEGHYRLPWFPLLHKPLAKLYLKILKRPTAGIDTLQYVTQSRIKRILQKIEKKDRLILNIKDINLINFEYSLIKKKLPLWFRKLYFVFLIIKYLKKLFKCECGVALFVYVNKQI